MNQLVSGAAAVRLDEWRKVSPAALALLLGIASLVVPTLISLARDYWSTDNGAHGPIILLSGLWLFWREREKIRFRPGSISIAWLAWLLPPLLLLYVYGRSFHVLFLESATLYALLVLLGFYYWGAKTMRRLWFALLYVGFLVKPPSGMVAELTQPLKIWISETSVGILYAFGYPVGNTGVSIQIAQHELLVQQACAGLGSIFSLLAIGLLYLHVTRPHDRVRSAILIAGIIPIAVLANLLRVVLLILLTYYAGSGVAQSLVHDLAGVITFVLAVIGMFTLDSVLNGVRGKR